MPPEIKIASRLIGPGRKPLVVAEIGGNHGGDVSLARRLIEAAADCRADAVKFQAYRSSEFLSPLSPYYDELAAEELKFEELAGLISHAKSIGLIVGLTAFDWAGLELAKSCGADFIKISSGDITYSELLKEAVKRGLPLFVSTGAANEKEVRQALEHLLPARQRLVLMQCASLYPAPPDSARLGVMKAWLAEGLAAGYSDHISGLDASLAALNAGALVLEKHFTISRNLPGGDNSISAEPEEMRALAFAAKKIFSQPQAEKPVNAIFLGGTVKTPHPQEEAMRALIRRVVVAVGNLEAGQRLASSDLALKRPPTAATSSFPPDSLSGLIGRTLAQNLINGQALEPTDLTGNDHG